MKALSVKQPWAELIVSGVKDVENRTWNTNFRGKILIHAPKSIEKYNDILNLLTKEQLSKIGYNLKTTLNDKTFMVSSIIGEVEIVDCVKNYNSIWSEKDCYHWVLKNAVKYEEPITDVKGKLSLWDFNLNDV